MDNLELSRFYIEDEDSTAYKYSDAVLTSLLADNNNSPKLIAFEIWSKEARKILREMEVLGAIDMVVGEESYKSNLNDRYKYCLQMADRFSPESIKKHTEAITPPTTRVFRPSAVDIFSDLGG